MPYDPDPASVKPYIPADAQLPELTPLPLIVGACSA